MNFKTGTILFLLGFFFCTVGCERKKTRYAEPSSAQLAENEQGGLAMKCQRIQTINGYSRYERCENDEVVCYESARGLHCKDKTLK